GVGMTPGSVFKDEEQRETTMDWETRIMTGFRDILVDVIEEDGILPEYIKNKYMLLLKIEFRLDQLDPDRTDRIDIVGLSRKLNLNMWV
ncbi:MAG: hypothetical protein KAS32_26480, partial [Candidatus Peribacteraceae bacterium]|nr:hypothetical protein [Candidatus Peribacteraceae bacterium]